MPLLERFVVDGYEPKARELANDVAVRDGVRDGADKDQHRSTKKRTRLSGTQPVSTVWWRERQDCEEMKLFPQENLSF